MIYKSVILPIASEDVRDNAKRYNTIQKGLGKRFTQTVRNHIKFICENPYIYSVRHDDIRASLIKKFPFLILYYINEKDKEIVVISVFHTSRNPNIRKSRE